MLPDRVSNPGPLTYESGALPTALPGPAKPVEVKVNRFTFWRGNLICCFLFLLPYLIEIYLESNLRTHRSKLFHLRVKERIFAPTGAIYLRLDHILRVHSGKQTKCHKKYVTL